MFMQTVCRTLPGAALVLCSLLALGIPPAVARAPAATRSADTPWPAVVVYVIDGDTVGVRPLTGGKPVSLRIEGIDAPEICQAGGKASREALRVMVQGQHVVVHGRRRDQYDRLLATLDLQGKDVGRAMVTSGWAWSYRFRRDLGPYRAQEQQARAAGRGLFAQRGVIEPRQFRKEHGSCRTR